MAPALTLELRETLRTKYEDNKRYSAFLVYYDKVNGNIQISSWYNVAVAYDARYAMIIDEGYTATDFLIVNTFKEFEGE